MLSHTKKFIFIHIGKTGGNSLNRLLKPYSAHKVVVDKKRKYKNRIQIFTRRKEDIKHANIEFWDQKLVPEIFEMYFKFAFVRNPWDRMVSYYSFLRPKQSGKINPFKKFLYKINPEFYSQLKYISVNGKVKVDFIGRFESYARDVKKLCSKLEIPLKSLPHENKTKHQHYSFYYDNEAKGLVEKKFSREIKEFGYKFEGEQ